MAFGTQYYDFHTGWQSGIQSTANGQVTIWKNFFTSYGNWYALVPDQTNVICTAGFGTATGNRTGNVNTDNFVTTAGTADGSLVICYNPQGSTLTIDMTKLRGTVTARWFDPTNGAYSSISGSPFANTGSHNFSTPGNNAAGDPDWCLVLTA
jgi:hypothetical protein